MSLKPGQSKCINTLDRSLVVAAGAGSGKTFTLTKRIAHAILSGAVDGMERVCAITFTNKAAGELKSRIKAELRAQGRPDEALKVDEAWVSTIHGMCARILRAHALELDLDPSFKMADAPLQNMLCDWAIDEVLADAQAGLFGPEEEFDQTRWQHALDDLFSEYQARSSGQGATSVESMLHELMAKAGGNVRGFDAFIVPKSTVNPARLLDVVLESFEALVELANAQKPNEAREAWAAETTATIMRIREELPGESVGDPLWVLERIDELAVPKKMGSADYKEQVAQVHDMLHMCVMELRLAAASGHLETLVTLAREAYRRFCLFKRQKGVLDNDDLLVLASDAVSNHPRIAALYADKFQLIMVDEFQDTDQMQVDMIKKLAGPGACRLCTVGDAQQSIYRFRGADVSVYRRHLESVRANDPDDVILLPDNFRSHRDVLALVDRIFERPQMFGGEFMSLAPGRDEARVKLPFSPDVPRVQVHLTSNAYGSGVLRDDVREVAAERIADVFADLHRRGHSAGEMALLLGGMPKADVYASALRARGLACVIAGGSVFASTVEANVVLDLVRVMANPFRTQTLHNVLTGPLFELCAEDLIVLTTAIDQNESSIRRKNLYEGLMDCVRAIKREVPASCPVRLVMAARVMGDMFDGVAKSTIARLVMRVVIDSGWLWRLEQRGAEGLAAAANVYKAVRMVDSIERESACGPARVAQQFEELLAQAKEAPGALSATGGDFVRIMSVHASKGLEFPVVAVAEFKEPRADTSKLLECELDGNVYLSLDLGKSASAFGRAAKVGNVGQLYTSMMEGRVDEDELADAVRTASGALELRAALFERDRIGDDEESKRLLYVALTRAKEALVVSLMGTRTKANPLATPKSCLSAVVDALAGEEVGFDVGISHFDYKGSAAALVEHVALEAAPEGGSDAQGGSGEKTGASDREIKGAREEPDEQRYAVLDMPNDQVEPDSGNDAFIIPAPVKRVHAARVPYAPAHQDVFSYSSIAEASHESDILDQLAASFAVSADSGASETMFLLSLTPSGGEGDGVDFALSARESNRRAAVADEDDGSWAYTGVSCADADKATDLGTAFHRLAQYAVVTRGGAFDANRDGAFEERGADGMAALVKPGSERISALALAGNLDEVAKTRLEEALDRWFASEIAAAMGALENLAAEVPFFVSVPIENRKVAGQVFLEGEIDLLGFDREGQRALVVDYKTGGRTDETQDELMRKHVLQASCYAYAILLQGAREVDATFVRVERPCGDRPDQPQCVRYHFEAGDLPVLCTAIAQAYACR